MRTDDKLRVRLADGRTVEAELQVYRTPSMYHRDDPDKDTLGLCLESCGKSRAVTVNRLHKTWRGTHDAIVRFMHEFCEGKLGSEMESYEVLA